jgi:hypothetical protein
LIRFNSASKKPIIPFYPLFSANAARHGELFPAIARQNAENLPHTPLFHKKKPDAIAASGLQQPY